MSKFFSIVKKINLAVLITTIVTISIEKGILLLIATYHYYLTQVPWFEWLNYLILAIGTIFLPIFSLFFLNRIHIRRFLRWYLFGMMFTLVFVLIEDALVFLGTLWNYERSFNVILVILEFFSLAYCWLFLTRQFRGKSLISVDIDEKDHFWKLKV